MTVTRSFKSSPSVPGARPRLLIVEDEEQAAKTYVRALGATFDITLATNGIAATTILQEQSFDIILSDIRLPGITGIELLRLIRSYDLAVPVLLMSAAPELTDAIHAVDLGALGYMIKPFELKELERRLLKGLTLRRLAQTKHEAIEVLPTATTTRNGSPVIDRCGLGIILDRAIEGMHLLYQPIVSVSERRIVAYEALMRSRQRSMASPDAILEAAERLGEISKVTARVTGLAANAMPLLPEATSLFVNIHALDLTNDALWQTSPLVGHAKRVVLEITERGQIDAVPHLSQRARLLRDAGYRLAIDDLGAGYAGLTTFASIEPEIIKIDMALVRAIDTSIVRQRIVNSLVQLGRELSMIVVAEGVETAQELGCLTDIGCDLLQGYLLARPKPQFVATFTAW